VIADRRGVSFCQDGRMAAWLVWLIAGLILIAAEVLSGDLWLLMIGLGALGGSAAAAVTGNLVISAIVFGLASVALIGFARPMLKRRLPAGTDIKTNTSALIGAHATVVSPVDADDGRVKIGGEIWSARTTKDCDPCPAGSAVIVVEIAGATAIVAELP
jgi:membrane protein implicated in regulation of membrane protease activity